MYIVCTTQLLIRYKRSSLLSPTLPRLTRKQITKFDLNLNSILVSCSFPPILTENSTSFIQVRN